MTVPGYPVTGTITKYIGGEVYNMPLLKENNFLPDLDAIPEDIAKKQRFYISITQITLQVPLPLKVSLKSRCLRKKYDIAVIHDAAYIELTYGEKQESFLSIPGAKEVGVEIHSLSKSFNMTGWRMAFVCGSMKVTCKGFCHS